MQNFNEKNSIIEIKKLIDKLNSNSFLLFEQQELASAIDFATVEKKGLYPIPGYSPELIPKPNSADGGFAWSYFPLAYKDKMTLNTSVTKKDFPKIDKSESETLDYFWNTLTDEHLQKIIPFGTVRTFIDEDGTKYSIQIAVYQGKFENKFVFDGYVNQAGKKYISPNPEDYKNVWEKFIDKHGGKFQVAASILAIALLETFLGPLGAPLLYRIMMETLVEIGINSTIAYAELKRGDDPAANLTMLFSFLPLINTRLLGIKTLSKQSINKIIEALEATKENLSTKEGLEQFYNSMDDPEKYIFSRVLENEPELLKLEIQKVIKELMNDKEFVKNNFIKVMFKDKHWWKDMGLQLPVALSGVLIKMFFFNETYTSQQQERVKSFIKNLIIELGEEKSQEIIGNAIQKNEKEVKNFIVTDSFSQSEITDEDIKNVADVWVVYDTTALKILKAKLDAMDLEAAKIIQSTNDSEKENNLKEINLRIFKENFFNTLKYL